MHDGSLIKTERFKKSIKELRSNLLEHTRIQTALELMDVALEFHDTGIEAELYKIVGPSGVGKTSSIAIFKTRHPPVETESGITRPVVAIEVPPKTNVKGIFLAILKALDAYIPGMSLDVARLQLHVHRELKEQKVQVLIIDEAQNLAFNRTDKYIADANSWVRALLNANICQVVLVGLPETDAIESETGDRSIAVTAQQLTRRKMQDLELTPFDIYDEDDFSEYKDILCAFDEMISINEPSDLDEFARQFHEATDGLVGRTSSLINRAFRIAAMSDRDSINLVDLSAAFDDIYKGRINPFEAELNAAELTEKQNRKLSRQADRHDEMTSLRRRSNYRAAPDYTK